MKRNNSLFLLIIAIVLALVAAWLANNWLFNIESAFQSRSEAQTKQVVVATLNIPYGQTIGKNAIKLQSMPSSVVSKDNFTSIKDLDGLVTNGDIFPGEILNKQRVTDKSLGAILASLIDKEMRAVTVRVNDVIGVAGFLLPNNRVDVLASRQLEKRAVVKTVLQNIKVLAVDQTASSQNKDSSAVVVRAVTLEVTPKQAEKLYQAIKEGSIQLALRNPDDELIAQFDSKPQMVEFTPVTPAKEVLPKSKPKTRVVSQDYFVTIIRGAAAARKRFQY